MNIVFKSKREMYAVSLGIVLLIWGALSMVIIMLWSMRTDGIVTLDFNAYGELWIEFSLAIGISAFGFWLMWFVARKSRVGRDKIWTNATGSGYRNDAGNWEPPGIPLMFHRSSKGSAHLLIEVPCEICGEAGEHEHYGVWNDE